ncbi:hypothetical protein MNBD_NITROSPINAE02-872 [hydrothermal vent metagenome]|uniref:DJ-1/PfpI domain-containing protein n=1 Tax=hydrothermal vent metagenome TaxID=652676 RepID=A0A3B1CY56_9ZZZZ
MAKNILMVIAPENFRDEELNHPREEFLAKGADITIASTQKGVAAGMLGHKENVDNTLEDVAGKTFDAVVIVGGRGSPTHLWDNALLHDIVRRHLELGKLVCSICLSGAVLAKAGILKGVDATVWKEEDSLKVFSECGAHFIDKPVVVSGNIITGRGPFAAREFGQTIISELVN